MPPLLCLPGCRKKQRDKPNPYLGNMADHSYSGQVTPERRMHRVNATGRKVCVDEFKGRFVWADYTGPWCAPCRAQAHVIKELSEVYPRRVTFLTVLTSESAEYNHVPTQKSAASWAGSFRLDPGHVVVATNLWAWTVPTHILYSPEGQTLYRSTGYLDTEQMKGILARYIKEWDDWSETGKKAAWMKDDPNQPVHE